MRRPTETTLGKAADSIRGELPKSSAQMGGAALSEYIVKGYRRICEQSGNITAFQESNSLAPPDFFKWYDARYRVHYGMESGHGGINRYVREDSEYKFDDLYNQKTFCAYLQEGGRGSNFCQFILHVSVAFLLYPDEINVLLNTYGYLPLHAKNIHHIAIYTVLQEHRLDPQKETNPFREIRAYYEEAYAEIGFSDEESMGSWDQTQYSTRVIWNQLEKIDSLSKEQFMAFIEKNRNFLNQRHNRLLREHKTMSEIFAFLYDELVDFEKLDHQTGWESSYSLYHFMCEFCKPLEHRRFNDNLYGQIEKKEKHPTRELMIVLWMYSFSFLYRPDIFITVNGSKFPKSGHYWHGERWFNVSHYLSDKNGPLSEFCDEPSNFDQTSGIVRQMFDGNDLVNFINKKLSDYSWGVLNSKRRFDACILNLSRIQIQLKEDGECKAAKFREKDGSVSAFTDEKAWSVDNVPVSLALIVNLLRNVKGNPEDLPLECDYYEQI